MRITDGSVLPLQCPEIGVSSDDDCSAVNRVLHHLVISRAGRDDFIDVLCGISLSGQKPHSRGDRFSSTRNAAHKRVP
jgi:hypothetical protein